MAGPLRRAAVVGACLAGLAAIAVAEDVTLTTYYPSPRGVYNELRTSGDVGIGDIVSLPGARLHVLQDGAANAFRVDDQPADPTPFVIDASGNVGIGTSAPAQALHVVGHERVDAGQVQFGRFPADPSAIGNGAVYYNTSSGTFRGFQGGVWKELGIGNCQVCYQRWADGDWGQCGPPYDAAPRCAVPGTWTQPIRDDTDDRPGGCYQRWMLLCS